MANERNPNDLYDPDRIDRPNDPYRVNDPTLDADAPYRRNRLENESQADPELAQGPASGAKIALLALGIAVLLGAVFYGLNNTSVHQSGASSTAQNPPPTTAQNTAPASPPAAPPGMRDVTPGANTGPRVTTGAAPSQTPPPPASTGPANNAPASK